MFYAIKNEDAENAKNTIFFYSEHLASLSGLRENLKKRNTTGNRVANIKKID